MELLVIGAIGVVVYFLYENGTISINAQSVNTVPPALQAAIAPPRITSPTPGTVPGYPPVAVPSSTSQIIGGATAIGGGLAQAANATSGLAASVPIIGAAAGLIASLLGAHEQRIKEAKNENAAMNNGVQGFDQGIRLINQQYNAGAINAATAIQALQQLYGYFWSEVGPQVQPGRNGCNSGSNCEPMLNVGRSGKQNCTGDIGAACCVGCNDLYMSLYATASDPWVPKGPGAITVLQQGGGTSYVKTVYGNSAYGGADRPGYTLYWNRQ